MPRFSHATIAHSQSYPPLYSTEEIIEATFQHFRSAGFPYRNLPKHVCMQELNTLARTRGKTLLHSNLCYQVADTYHPHRFEGHAQGKISPYAAFMDDRRLYRAIKLAIEAGSTIDTDYFGTLSLVLGTQACSNFRPGFASYIYRRYCPHNEAVVLDTSTGYGGRMLGAFASGVVAHYLGVDPSTKTHKGNRRMANELGFGHRVTLFNKPAEDVDPTGAVLSHYVERGVDLAFTSPPYFAKELYTDEPTQSRLRYPTPKGWYTGFLIPTMRLQFEVLRPGALAIMNIADVNLKNKRYYLSKWCEMAAQIVGFEYVERLAFEMSTRYGANQVEEVATEPVLVFRKPL